MPRRLPFVAPLLASLACGSASVTPAPASAVPSAPPPTSSEPIASAPAPSATVSPAPKDEEAAALAAQAAALEGQLAILGGARPGSSSSTTPKPPPPKDKGDVRMGGVTATVPVPQLDRTMAALRPRMKACYERGLATEPAMKGRVLVTARLAPNGEAASADVASNTGIAQTVAACITSLVKRAEFQAPGAGGSTLSIPIVFELAK